MPALDVGRIDLARYFWLGRSGAYDVTDTDGSRPDWSSWRPAVRRFVDINEVGRLAESLAGVRCGTPSGRPEWRYHGRLVARQLDEAHLVIRADFDYRDSILRQLPGTFSVPARYLKHMMVVADLANGDAGAIEDAIEAAWLLQRSAD